MTTKKKVKATEPEMTLAEIRTALDGQEKEVFIKVDSTRIDSAPSFLKNKTPEEIHGYLTSLAEEADFPEGFKLDNRTIPVTKSRRKYTYGQGYHNRVTAEKEGPYWVLVGYEPYTDEELLEKGTKLVAAKKKRDAAAAKRLKKKVDDYNIRARELGQPTITVEDVS